MLKRKKAPLNKFDQDFLQFPMLATESWRVNEFIEEEAVTQRSQLCVLLGRVRILIAIVALIAIMVLRPLDSHYWTVVTVMVFYILFVFALLQLSRRTPENIYMHNFLATLAEIALLGYLGFVLEKQIAISFIFLSMALSAMLLPFWRLLMVMQFAAIVVTVVWLGVTPEVATWILNGLVDTEALLVSDTWRWLINVLLGLFILGFIVYRLATWSFKNDVKAKFRYKQMRQVLSFNRAVIEHLRSGVIVVSGNGKMLSINRRALVLLNVQTSKTITEIAELSTELDKRFRSWLSAGVAKQTPYQHNDNAEEVLLSFDSFGDQLQRNIIMITLESVNETLEQAQDAKLAALGRLTAGVAHEIRNPLASINSASQLLSETTENPTHQNLSRVILKNVKRTNQIISDILGLFKDTKAERELLSSQLLHRYADEFTELHQKSKFELRVVSKIEQELFFYFDAGQLEQVLWNLLQNAIKYAQAEPLRLVLRYSLSEARRSLYIDVIDNGKGIPPEKVTQIYEPFFTGGSGSGLGLYLVRELCSANGANITYLPIKKRVESEGVIDEEKTVGACFRITTPVYFTKNLKPKIAK